MRSLATKASVASKARSKISRSRGSNWCRSDLNNSHPHPYSRCLREPNQALISGSPFCKATVKVTRPIKANRLRKLDCHCGAFPKGADENKLLGDTSLVKEASRFKRFGEHCVRHMQRSGHRAFLFLLVCFTDIDNRHVGSVDRTARTLLSLLPSRAAQPLLAIVQSWCWPAQPHPSFLDWAI